MIFKRIYLLLLFLVSNGSMLVAQPFFDLINFNWQLSGPTQVSGADSADSEIAQFQVDLSIPIKINKNIFATNVSISRLEIVPQQSEAFKLNSFSVSEAFVKQWQNEKLKTSFVVIGKANYNQSIKLGNTSFQLGAAVLHSIKKKQNLTYKFGVYYNSEFFGPFILPLAGIDWRINNRLTIHGILPSSMNLEFKANKKVNVGLAFRSITSSFRLEKNEFYRISDNHVRVFSDFYVYKKNVISLELGHSILRNYRPGIRISGDTKYSDYKINDGYLIRIAYAYRFRLDDNK